MLSLIKRGSDNACCKPHLSKKTNRVRIQARNNYAISFGADLAYLLGFKIKEVTEEAYGLIKGVRVGENEASITGGFNNIYVYTDIIKEVPVGGVNAPLLRIVNLSLKTNDEGSTSIAYDELYYHPLKSSYVETVNIQLRDEIGELVHFASGTVIATLAFRQAKKAI